MRIFPVEDESAPLSKLDPRARVLGALGFSVLAVLLDKWEAIAAAALVAAALLAAAKAFRGDILKRHAEINLLAAFLLLFVPLSTPGEPLFTLGPLSWSREGAVFAARLAAKANIVMLACGALLATMDPTTLARAVRALGAPEKLAQIMFFCVRYLDTAHVEFHKLRNAMRARGFRARCDAHSLRSLGYFLGMLFVRGVDRSDRILEAMKCRGFNGRLRSLAAFEASWRDAVFAAAMLAVSAGIAALEWGERWIS